MEGLAHEQTKYKGMFEFSKEALQDVYTAVGIMKNENLEEIVIPNLSGFILVDKFSKSGEERVALRMSSVLHEIEVERKLYLLCLP